MFLTCVAGLIAGLIHVFAGPDHLVALAPLSLQAGRRAWIVGLRWGVGHSAGVLMVALLAFSFRQVFHFEALSGWGERLVGATLIGLGLWGLRSLFREQLHAHRHQHADGDHVHFHVHSPDEAADAPAAHEHSHAAFWVGTLHGFAGTAHLLGILPSLALPTGLEMVCYLAAFAIGTVLAMMAFAGAIGRLSPRRTEKGLRAFHWALGGASGLCLLTGMAWILLPLFDITLP